MMIASTKDLDKTLLVIQSVSEESRISSIKKEIAAVPSLLRNDVQVFCASSEFRKDSSLALRMTRGRNEVATLSINRHCEGGTTEAIPNSEHRMGDRHSASWRFPMTALTKTQLQQENK
ncbi:MAG: hypothetical protein WAU36_06990 [Cyclobacteriaceae bacterium]